jgi:alpha-D-ribose 1-methylphosphonate 5-triphosphate synthase subunit PhnG
MSENDAAAPPDPERRHWMAVLARADGETIAALLAQCGDPPRFTRLRGPESGLVMVRGRTGGNGAAFNLGEVTVTRCTVRLRRDGQSNDGGGQDYVGHAYVTGRDERQAELAAVVDALLQDPVRRDAVRAAVIEPLARAQQEARDLVAAKAAATKVQFFSMRTMRT